MANATNQLNDIVDQIRRDAFQLGYRAGLRSAKRAVLLAIDSIVEPADSSDTMAPAHARAAGAERLPRGHAKEIVEKVLLSPGFESGGPTEIAAMAIDLFDEKLPLSSVRHALTQLASVNLAVGSGSSWRHATRVAAAAGDPPQAAKEDIFS